MEKEIWDLNLTDANILDIVAFKKAGHNKDVFIDGATWHKTQLQPLVDSHAELLKNLLRLVDRMEENELGHMSAVTRAKSAIEKAKQIKP